MKSNEFVDFKELGLCAKLHVLKVENLSQNLLSGSPLDKIFLREKYDNNN